MQSLCGRCGADLLAHWRCCHRSCVHVPHERDCATPRHASCLIHFMKQFDTAFGAQMMVLTCCKQPCQLKRKGCSWTHTKPAMHQRSCAMRSNMWCSMVARL